MSKSQRSLCVSFSRTGAGLCIYHLLVRSNLNFLHISQWITLSTQLCLVLYSFCANLLHSLMWLIVSSLPPHSLYLLFCCVLSILALILLVLLALFYAATRRDSLLLLLLLLLIRVFHISVSWWSFTGDWVSASLLSVGHGYLSMAVLFSSIEATLIEEQQ